MVNELKQTIIGDLKNVVGNDLALEANGAYGTNTENDFFYSARLTMVENPEARQYGSEMGISDIVPDFKMQIVTQTPAEIPRARVTTTLTVPHGLGLHDYNQMLIGTQGKLVKIKQLDKTQWDRLKEIAEVSSRLGVQRAEAPINSYSTLVWDIRNTMPFEIMGVIDGDSSIQACLDEIYNKELLQKVLSAQADKIDID
jgi:hypothetical protein